MGTSSRLVGAAVTTLALVLTGVGVYFAAADTNPTGLSDSSLALHGRPPTSLTADLSISTNGPNQITGTIEADLATGDLRGQINVPTVFATTSYTIIIDHGTVYLGAPSLESILTTPWVSIPKAVTSRSALNAANLVAPVLANSGHELTQILPAILGQVTVTHEGPFTTYHSTHVEPRLSIPKASGLKIPRDITLTSAVTVASAGQLASLSETLSDAHSYFRITLTVLSYDHPVHITAPPASSVRPLTPALRHQVLGNEKGGLNQLLTPAGIASLGQIRIN